MPKRSRYDLVTVNDNTITIYADGTEYVVPRNLTWCSQQFPSYKNPEEVVPILFIQSPFGDYTIVCRDEEENEEIMEQLIAQGV
jgi:hypothetical protein